jgi:hypothetical protein
MGNMKFKMSPKWFILLLLVFLAGCASQAVFIEERGEDWLARPVDDLRKDIASPGTYSSKVKAKEETYPMADGYYGLVEPIGSECAIHWKINPRNKVVGYAAKGQGCDTRTTKDLELYNLKQTTKPGDDTMRPGLGPSGGGRY